MAGETVLVVGGAGYIGSHTCLDLANKGYRPVVFDNFSNGHREFVRWGPAEEGDIRDRARLDEVLAKHKPAAILHFAALIEVGESVKDPVSFYENNVIGTLTLLSAAQAAGINAFVFSSTCATYGLPQSVPLDETHRQVPINPYGRTKYIVEQALADYDQYGSLRSVVLRYFNAAGADFEGRIGEWHQPETHAIPLAIDAALGRRQGFKVFGSDYETRDGTCVRDYIHVLDLADAHVRAVEYLLKGGDSVALNLGTGTGTTVKELLGAIEEVSNRPFPVEYIGRREGDSHTLVANNDKARDVLGWVPQYDLSEIIRSAWDWHAKSNQH
ncbi:UDP-glucose 4-epimerase GalE [Rhizobium leguminosarum]|uniref:UDP-glucose 4-epimerase n=1 Tax=Rhizobium leguminosarum bv. trifolii TaxID=386 RepID=EXOB_RHILT|nr:UDP-glucose 4-epimerase GalE [Rhizobium leguminosarum]Q59745.1 RecName: Full=UDP-glucose 4-epimerase; AltName: Full=Galactowaldenase; AltName: Full=UDP-galactose 4-epimerase [Rhizobium leguminosarum bv. trifolii]MBP2485076.1 UDP-glucose 4-epimerase [Rhizobium leguminosarum]MDI5926116.1 UDP-glucose 4-epimerase GalE [Rhizobium leguminosarum]CAA65359.1 UDP-glucose 4-epimerase [Rhizobium leguminosarum]